MQNVNDVAAAILDELGAMDTMKLEKLAYYSQAWSLAIYDEPLFENAIEAWAQGPVIEELYQQHRGRRVISTWPGDRASLTPEASNVVVLVCRKYGNLSGDELSTLTHAELPWRAARGGLPATMRSRAAIDRQGMAKFYRSQELGGRVSADLAVGGVHPLPQDRSVAPEQVLHKLRVDLERSLPAMEPASEGCVSRVPRGEQVQPAAGSIRERTRVRPSRV